MIADTLRRDPGRYFCVRELWDGKKDSIIKGDVKLEVLVYE